MGSNTKPSTAEYWQNFLRDLEPCHFPKLLNGINAKESASRKHVPVELFSSAQEINGFCRKANLDIKDLFQATWAVVLKSYIGAEQMSFAVANCRHSSSETSRSLFLCQAQLGRDDSIFQILNQMREDRAQCSPHAFTSFDDIPGLEEQAMCNSMVLFEEIGSGQMVFQKGLGNARMELINEQDIVVLVQISGHRIKAAFHYVSSIMSEAQAMSVASTFSEALSSILDDSAKLVGQVNVVSDLDLERLWGWNETWPETASECAGHYFQHQVQETPEATAVFASDATFSYLELDTLSTKLAYDLVGKGVGPEVIVPLCFEKSAWAVVAILGVVKAGGGFVMLDPTYPMVRLEDILEQIEANLLLTSARHYDMWASRRDLEANVISRQSIQRMPSHKKPPATAVTPSNVLYIIFTSGSTGKPKGCVIEHSAYLSGAFAQIKVLTMGPGSRVLQFAAYTFDVSILETITALLSGACICIPDDNARSKGIMSMMNEMRITWSFLTPSLVKLIGPDDVPDLETLVLGGEAVSSSDVATWAGRVQLMNGYGPSETSIAAAINPTLTSGTDSANIGFGVGGCLWVVDPNDYNHLVPIGAVGELVIEGPILARHYMNNPEKTASAFVENPEWMAGTDSRSKKRLYMTGDLVRCCPDGSITFIGRKDSQVKVRGQRIELGEIEHYLFLDSRVRHVMVAMPGSGPCKKRLVAIVAFNEIAHESSQTDLQIVDITQNGLAQKMSEIRDYVSGKLPTYMVPATWIVVEAVPFTPSGKMDRVRVRKWIESMTQDAYLQIGDIDREETPEVASTSTDLTVKLQQIVGHVLNLPFEAIALHRSFLNLGGDSISAMQVMTECKSNGMSLKIKDIMQCKTISELATCIKSAGKSSVHDEEIPDTLFDLSPIQQLYFQLEPNGSASGGPSRYNQSFMLRLNRHMSSKRLGKAIHAVVRRHAMLRARFQRQDNGKWKQYFVRPTHQCYSFKEHQVSSKEGVERVVAVTQAEIDILNGPVFSADLFNERGGQLLSLIAHHAVVDLVSWRTIMREIEEALDSEAVLLKKEKSLSFQSWCRLQAEYSVQSLTPKKALPIDIAPSNLEYWGMDGKENRTGDTLRQCFKLDADTTSLLLGPECHRALRTEPLDIFLSALVHSFSIIFTDRRTPTIFREGHGREPWDDGIDIAGTVGWFTSIYPVHVDACEDFLESLRRMKDNRRAVPGNGWPYFACRYNTQEGIDAFGGMNGEEIQFDYLGLYQQLQREGALFQQEPWALKDVGRDVQRFALFEITTEVVSGQLQLTFEYSRLMRHQAQITAWVFECEKTLKDAAEVLHQSTAQCTLSDFPLLSMDYAGLEKLSSVIAPRLGLSSMDDIEDVYPTSPMQTGLLLSQVRGAGWYQYSSTFQVSATTVFQSLDVRRLSRAWEQVVARHPSLRTVFVESTAREGAFDQVVIKNPEARVIRIKSSKSEYQALLKKQQAVPFLDLQPPHRLTICELSTGEIFIKLDINHALVDGSSMPVLIRDLSSAYENQLPETKAPLYSEYIAYLQDWPAERGLEYWSSYLTGVEPCYFPILDDGQPQEQALEVIHINLGVASGDLNHFCQRNGITMSNLFQAVWAIVLQSYIGSDQVCFGYLVSGRDVPIDNIGDAIGAFINMLVCRLNMTGSLSQLLEDVRESYINSLPHQHCSLADVQHCVDANLMGQPLFNTVINFQGEAFMDTGSSISFKFVDQYDPTEYNIAVDIAVSNNQLEVSLIYRTSALSTGQATNVASAFKAALNSMLLAKDETVLVQEIECLSEEHLQQVWKMNESVPQRIEMCIHSVIEGQVLMRESSPAICSWDGDYSYGELDRISTRLARHLVHEMGVGPEILVPLCFEKSAWAVIAMLAVLKAGGGFVLLDPSHAIQRLEGIIADIDATILLSSETQKDLFASSVLLVLPVGESILDRLQADDHYEPRKNAHRESARVNPSNTAYVIFTSGTTGKPKGSLTAHAAFCTSAAAHGKRTQITPSSRVFQYANYSFDACLQEILTTFMFGGCVCIPSEDRRMNDVVGAINDMDVNWAVLTPSVIRLITPSQVPGLKFLILAGESMSKSDIETWKGPTKLMNGYGPSECAVASTYNTDMGTDPSNIGRAVGGLCWIVNPKNHDRLTPLGCIGELLVEGNTLAKGYLKNPEKTAEVFITNPAWTEMESFPRNGRGPIRRFYKTGDLVRMNSDGSLSFFGRKDLQIKFHGQRIELHEIEHHMMASSVKPVQAVVEVCRPKARQGEQTLVSFVLSQDPDSGTDSGGIVLPLLSAAASELLTLQTRLADYLPNYMIPSVYIPVKRFPTNSSGKMDRKKLQLLVDELSTDQLAVYSLSSTEKREPQTEMEICLRSLWSETLGLSAKSIGADDSFFRIGGDSIGAMKIVAAARNLGVILSVADIFSHPKLSDLAKVTAPVTSIIQTDENLQPFALWEDDDSLDSLLRDVAAQCGVENSDIQDLYPCTPLQEGLMALTSQQHGAYVGRSILHLRPSLDIQRLQNAWNKVVALNPILRTRIVNIEAAGSLQVLLNDEILWQTAESLEEYLSEDKEIPIIYGGRLSRYAIVGRHTEGLYFVWTAHHSLYDGWSQDLVFGQVQRMYDEDFVPSPVPFNHFINYLSSGNSSDSETFWRDQLAGEIPVAYPQLPSTTYVPRADQVFERKILISRNSQSEIMMSTIIRAAWALTLARYSDVEDIIFGATLSGRNSAVSRIAEVVGPTITTVPVRLCLDFEKGTSEFLEMIQAQATDMIPHQHWGLQNITRLTKNSKFQNLLVINPDNGPDTGFLGSTPVLSGGEEDFSTYPLVVECTLGSGFVKLKISSDGQVVENPGRLLGHFEQAIRQLNDDTKEIPLRQLNLFSPEDKKQVWNWNASCPERISRCIHELFSKKAALQPDAPAICSWDAELTFYELDRLSTKLSYHLSTLGVGPEVIVPLCFEKSAWTTVALLGVLKAGGAFCLLDPSHPTKRLEEIVHTTGARILLSSQTNSGLLTAAVDSVFVVSKASIETLGADRPRLLKRAGPRNAAYVVFTSGTTGKPKGSVNEHSGFVTSSNAHGTSMEITASSRVLQISAYSFDVCILETLTTLLKGGCVCVIKEEYRTNPTELVRTINEMKINWATITPSLARLIQPETIPSMKTLVLGGEGMAKNDRSWAKTLRLMNAYGPSECAVASALNTKVTPDGDHQCIGRGVGSCLWIVEPQDHDRLAPVGCIGELLIEGSIVSRGYLNEPGKTADAFIECPSWLKGLRSSSRLYKTGDLVRYKEDGTIGFCGRKDAQVKVHGQRLELSEIEHQLAFHALIVNASVILPKSGLCKGRLVAVISLKDEASSGTDELQLIDRRRREPAGSQVSTIRTHLEGQLPAYMVPPIFAVVKSIPLNASGKMNKRLMTSWVENMPSDTYEDVMGLCEEQDAVAAATPMEKRLQAVVCRVLNLSEDQVSINRSFIGLGGDSITAMQVMARSQVDGIVVKIKDILHSKSLGQLALCATFSESEVAMIPKDSCNTPFDLSPAQQLCVKQSVGGLRGSRSIHDDGSFRFNQSTFLRFKRPTTVNKLINAINIIVGQHSMLRARFNEVDGKWTQQVKGEVAGSCDFQAHSIQSRSELIGCIASAQSAIDPAGPVFAARFFETGSGEQLLFMVAHSLVIDLISWRIVLRDLEELLETGTIFFQKSLSYQAWTTLQADHGAKALESGKSLPLPPAESYYDYWGMANLPNTYGDVLEDGFALDTHATAALIRDCHHTLTTEPVDIFLAALAQSFIQVFEDRDAPIIFSEGHGRESWGLKIDLTSVVGHFTTLLPVGKPAVKGVSTVDMVKMTKDSRRAIMKNGWPDVSPRFLLAESSGSRQAHSPMEIMFNFQGTFQQSERDDGLLQVLSLQTRDNYRTSIDSPSSDVGPSVRRLALFEISATIENGVAKLSFAYNQRMYRQNGIRQWVQAFRRTLLDVISALETMPPERTLSDFPLLSALNYESLDRFKQEGIQSLGLSSMAEIEDIYPCSPMQTGVLISQTRAPETYWIQSCFEVRSNSDPIEIPRVQIAWQKVVARHPSLRTVFIDGISQGNLFNQVVLNEFSPRILHIECGESDPLPTLNNLPLLKYGSEPPHRLILCRTWNKVYIKIEISHALVDAGSMGVILRDLAMAYEGSLSISGAPLYSDYIKYLQEHSVDNELTYWHQYLTGVEPCQFPSLNDGPQDTAAQTLGVHIDSDISMKSISTFCQENNMTISSVLQLAWALVLRSFTSMDRVCFGYLVSGRDVHVDGIQDAIGAFINMLVCRVDLDDRSRPLIKVLESTRENFGNSLQHQHNSLAEIQHSLNITGPLFNTAVSFHGEFQRQFSGISFEAIGGDGASEYDFVLDIGAAGQKLYFDLSHNTQLMSGEQCMNLGSTFEKALQTILVSSEKTVGQVDLFSERNHRQVWGWNNKELRPGIAGFCVHDIIEENVDIRGTSLAISSWDGNMTYLELGILSTRLASYLVGMDIGPEVLVPVCLEKSKWAVVAILAVMKAGGAFVLMDAGQTGRFGTIIRKTKANIVLASASASRALSAIIDTVVVVDDNLLSRLSSKVVTLRQPVTPQNAAYVLFTSGSTGEPKGCIIEHGSYCSSALAQKEAWGLSYRSRVLQFASFSFDASMGEILTTLMVGGCVCVPSESERLNDISAVIRQRHIDVVILTPTFAKLLNPENVPTVKTMILGGESTGKEHIRKWHDKVRLIPAYGPTECCLVSSSVMNLTVDTESTNIGVPNMANYWIVDPLDYNLLVPVGAIGELLIEGPIVGRGYLDSPAQTAAAFIENPGFIVPYSRGLTRRMYKSGDLVQYNSDGSFRYCGRADTQVKLRGQRIELSEVEHYLRKAISNQVHVAAEVLKLENEQAVLAAFICLGENFDGDETLANISTITKDRLHALVDGVDTRMAAFAPSFMIPTLFIPIRTLPLAPSLKTDRKRLRQVAASLSRSQLSFLQTRKESGQRSFTEMELRLQSLWATTLNIDPTRVTQEDSFLKLGGDSILAIKLVAACRADGLSISVSDVLRNLTLSQMASVVSSLDVTEQTKYEPFMTLGYPVNDHFLDQVICPQLLVDKSEIEDIVEGTNMQTLFTTTGLLSTRGNTNYFVFSLSGSVDSARLEYACQQLVQRHQILRTRFLTHHQQLLQVILRNYTPQFQRHQAAKWRLGHLAAKLAKLDQAEPITLGTPVVRFSFLDGGKQSLLVMRLSHSQYDGMSIRILVDDLAAFYSGQGVPHRPSFSEFVHRSQESNSRGADGYWSKLLKGSSMTDLVVHERPAYENTKIKIISRDVASLTSQEHGMTFATVLKAAWALVLAQMSGESNVVFGHLVSGRNLALGSGDINGVLGPCLNIIPVRVQLQEKITTVMDLLRDIHNQQLAAIPFETTGFSKIVQRCTDWPLWTRCSSVVQHQNLDGVEEHLKSFKFGHHDCKIGIMAPSHDSMDILVFSSPKGTKTRVDLNFCEKVIPSFLAEDLMELLCINIALLTGDVGKRLPPASLITSLPPQIPLAMKQSTSHLRIQASDDKLLIMNKSSALQVYDHSRLASTGLFRKNNPSKEIVMRAWASILSSGDQSPTEIDINVPFYDVWGSLLVASQFSEHYIREGFDVTMEEIIENPSMQMQTLLLSNVSATVNKKQEKTRTNSNLRVSKTESPLVKSTKFSKWAKTSVMRVTS
ncbi:hypothetical protein BKA61DRAFT_734232 [Leptodontidium sp. MPI-SDFR-AT-0119]|nr:hypothetical protein BKA61DRAFT_734232 [Leptodontidium sp. MPI-SDFR-AT-0119]